MQPEVLFLAHRIPFPPDKGDKIRSFHILDYLQRDYRVHLGTFVDDDEDWEYLPQVRGYCASSCILRLPSLWGRVKSLSGLLSGQPLTLPYYRSRLMQRWVRETLRQRPIQCILVFSSAMAQFVMDAEARSGRRVIDFVDVDSDKWRQYAENRKGPSRWIYRREARRLLQYETQVARAFDASLFVSKAEAKTFMGLSGLDDAAIGYMANGVDSEYFRPDTGFENPFPAGEQALVFVGAMDYWANVDAVRWFARDIFPRLQQRWPDIYFYIVGTRPGEEVLHLARAPGVRVTGRVEDVRPYLQHAAAVVAPLRIARGIQNKVLEAMAMARPLVATSQALEGIEAVVGREALLADDVEGFLTTLNQLLETPAPQLGDAARKRVCADFDWSVNLRTIGRLLEAPISRQ